MQSFTADAFFERSRDRNIRPARRIFLQFAGERNLTLGRRRRPARIRIHGLRKSFEHYFHNGSKKQDESTDEDQIEDRAEHRFPNLNAERVSGVVGGAKALFFVVGCFFRRVNASLGVAHRDQSRGKVHTQVRVDHGFLSGF